MSQNQKPKFIGNYVDELADAAIASAVTGEHLLVGGPPGGGKTTILRSAAEKIYGDSWGFIRMSPVTDPAEITGPVDPKSIMEDGKYVINKEGTVYDQKYLAYLADEFTRANPQVQELFVDALNRLDKNDVPDQDLRPVVWMTANFVQVTSRLEAVYNRVGLTFWTPSSIQPPKKVAEMHLRTLGTGATLQLNGNLPKWSDIQKIRKMTPSEDAIKACGSFVDSIATEIEKAGEGFVLDNRRSTIWSTIAFRMSAYEYGSDDFTQVSDKAVKALKLAYQSSDAEQANMFAQIVNACKDPVSVAIEIALEECYMKMVEVKENAGSGADAIEMTLVLGDAVRNKFLPAIRKLVETDQDPRYVEAERTLNTQIMKVARGG